MAINISAKFVRFETETNKVHVEYNDKRYILPVLPFQSEESFDKDVFCIIDQSDSESSYLQLDYEKYIREKYNENDEVDFKIISTRSDYYELRDEKYGLKSTIAKQRSINPTLSTLIHCRITNIKGRNISVTLVGEIDYDDNSLSNLYNLLLSQFDTKDEKIEQLCELITNETSQAAFNDECRKWILNTAQEKSNEECRQALDSIKQQCFKVLGESTLLPKCQLSERTIFEQRIGNVIEQTGYYIQSCEILSEGKAREELDSFFEILKKSGYHYHPRKWFSIVLNIFLQDFELMLDYVPKMLDVLQSQKMEVWKRNPIDSLWIEMLEFFIHSANGMIYRETSDKQLEELMIQMLIIQLRLNEGLEYSQIDEDLNRAMLYRIIARQNVNEPSNVLRHAFGQLVGSVTELPFLPTGKFDAEILANMISGQLSQASLVGGKPMQYETSTAAININNGCITASRKDVDSSDGKRILEKLQLSYNLDVILDQKIPKDLHNYHGLAYYKKLWNFISQALFEKRIIKEKNTRIPIEGDEVSIIVIEDLGGLRFRCKIVDEGIKGEGVLDASPNGDFTPYTYAIGLEEFYDNGRPLILYAQVKDIDEEGNIQFGISEYLQDYFDEYKYSNIEHDTTLICCLNTRKNNNARFPAVSMEGLPISVGIENYDSDITLEKGMIVEVDNCQNRQGDFFNATFVKVREDIHFNPREVVHNMLLDYSRGDVYEREALQEVESVEKMEKTHLSEIMSELEAMASLEKDTIRTYNYLSFCQLLAKMLDDTSSNEFYNRRRMLLEMLDDFETNNKIQNDKLTLMADDMTLFKNNVQLRNDVKKMKVISWLGRKEYEEDLFDICRNEHNEEIIKLAKLVQAFNYVDDAGLESQADAIRDKIRTMLQLKANTTNKHSYGQEDDITEFKTSLVTPAGASKPNPKEQTTKVLQEICAMLNAQGGTLYLGVNDAGYECGLEEDLGYKEFKGIKDKYKTYLDDNVAFQLGQEAASIVKTSWDTKVKSDVLVVKISPCPHPVAIHDDYYERMGTSARRVNEDYKPIFLANRKKWAEQNFPELFTDKVQKISQVDNASSTQEKAKVSNAETPRSAVDKIKTATLRNNILHDYEDDYEASVGYIYFTPDGKFKLSSTDIWEEDSHILTLSVHEDELDSYLILVYKNGYIAKVKLGEIMGRKTDVLLPRYSESELLFASIANDRDSLVLGLTDSKSKASKFLRVDDITHIEVCKIQQAGMTLTDNEISDVFFCDILPTLVLGDVVRNQKRTMIGHAYNSTHGKRVITALTKQKIKI